MRIMLKFDDVEKYFEGEFSDREPITIGRESDNIVALPLTVLSRHHARIFAENGTWYVEDLDSANGSFYRGKQLKPNAKAALADGDIVRFGTVATSIRFIAPPVEKVVEKVVEKEVIREVPVVRKFDFPKEINGKPVPAPEPGESGRPFRTDLKLPSDLAEPTARRVIRL